MSSSIPIHVQISKLEDAKKYHAEHPARPTKRVAEFEPGEFRRRFKMTTAQILTNVPPAAWDVCSMYTGPGMFRGQKGVVLFVSGDTPGRTIGRSHEKLGYEEIFCINTNVWSSWAETPYPFANTSEVRVTRDVRSQQLSETQACVTTFAIPVFHDSDHEKKDEPYEPSRFGDDIGLRHQLYCAFRAALDEKVQHLIVGVSLAELLRLYSIEELAETFRKTLAVFEGCFGIVQIALSDADDDETCKPQLEAFQRRVFDFPETDKLFESSLL
jgi:hypothetical protein